jgi:osmotically-inducible protein OsmY
MEQGDGGRTGAASFPLPPATLVAELAENGLRKSPYLALSKVSCEYHDGVLTLRGCLPRYHLKQIAQEVVAEVPGVEHIENQIEVVAGALQ